ncbi:hypothetical protein C0J52_07836 [Blattella germanica]|nr:hypothetical protein C0J52_07836 [Blattella germanica]
MKCNCVYKWLDMDATITEALELSEVAPKQQKLIMYKLVVFAALLATACAAPAPGHLLAAPVVSHTSYAVSHPAVVAHAPVAVATVAHAPVVSVAHAPLVAHHPIW